MRLADRPLHGERPALAEHPDPRQRLLEHDARVVRRRRRAHDEHEVEVAVPHLAHRERAGREPRAQVGAPVEVRLDGARLERLVAGRNGQSIQTRSWLSGSSIGDEMNSTWGAVVELAAVGRVRRDDPDVALLDRPRDAADGDRAAALEDVADLVVGDVDVAAERARVALEDEDAD